MSRIIFGMGDKKGPEGPFFKQLALFYRANFLVKAFLHLCHNRYLSIV